jgi:hypothetical protein
MEGQWFEIPPSAFLTSASVQGDEWCLICITASDDMDFLMLGSAFMRAFYVIHDDDNSRIGLIP